LNEFSQTFDTVSIFGLWSIMKNCWEKLHSRAAIFCRILWWLKTKELIYLMCIIYPLPHYHLLFLLFSGCWSCPGIMSASWMFKVASLSCSVCVNILIFICDSASFPRLFIYTSSSYISISLSLTNKILFETWKL